MKARDGLVVNLWTPLLFPWLPDPLWHTCFLQPPVPSDFTMPLAGLNAIFCLSCYYCQPLTSFPPPECTFSAHYSDSGNSESQPLCCIVKHLQLYPVVFGFLPVPLLRSQLRNCEMMKMLNLEKLRTSRKGHVLWYATEIAPCAGCYLWLDWAGYQCLLSLKHWTHNIF